MNSNAGSLFLFSYMCVLCKKKTMNSERRDFLCDTLLYIVSEKKEDLGDAIFWLSTRAASSWGILAHRDPFIPLILKYADAREKAWAYHPVEWQPPADEHAQRFHAYCERILRTLDITGIPIKTLVKMLAMRLYIAIISGNDDSQAVNSLMHPFLLPHVPEKHDLFSLQEKEMVMNDTIFVPTYHGYMRMKLCL